MTFGGLDYASYAPFFNAVYIRGKDKIVYWSTLDGKGRGAVYKKLPTGARTFETPTAPFKEEAVIDREFPESGRGAELLGEFAEYVQGAGADELMSAAVFTPRNTSLKPAREHINIAP